MGKKVKGRDGRENLQATSHGGWDRYRVLVAVDAPPWNERRQVAAG